MTDVAGVLGTAATIAAEVSEGPLGWATALAQYVPDIIGWIGGKRAGDAAAKIVAVGEKITGQSGQGMVDALRDHPEMVLQLQQQLAAQRADFEKMLHEEVLAELQANVEADKTAAADRASARQMQIAQPSVVPAILTTLLTLAVMGIAGVDLWAVLHDKDIPDNQIIGSILTGWGMALTYWLGGTRAQFHLQNYLAQSQPPSS